MNINNRSNGFTIGSPSLLIDIQSPEVAIVLPRIYSGQTIDLDNIVIESTNLVKDSTSPLSDNKHLWQVIFTGQPQDGQTLTLRIRCRLWNDQFSAYALTNRLTFTVRSKK